MYNNIGLKTVRGSGTNGYVQTNLAKLPTNWNRFRGRRRGEQPEGKKTRIFKPDPKLIEHNTKRAIEVKVFEFRTKLEDQDFDDDDIEDKVDAYRKVLQAQLEAGTFKVEPPKNKKNEKDRHDEAMERMKKNVQMKKALGISEDHVHGRAFDQDLQEAERRDRIARREKEMDLEEKIKSYDTNYLDRMGERERGPDPEAMEDSRRERARMERRYLGSRRQFSRSSSRGTKRRRSDPENGDSRRERNEDRRRERRREPRPDKIQRWRPDKEKSENVDDFDWDKAMDGHQKDKRKSRKSRDSSDSEGPTRKKKRRRDDEKRERSERKKKKSKKTKKKKKKRKAPSSSESEDEERAMKKRAERQRRAQKKKQVEESVEIDSSDASA